MFHKVFGAIKNEINLQRKCASFSKEIVSIQIALIKDPQNTTLVKKMLEQTILLCDAVMTHTVNNPSNYAQWRFGKAHECMILCKEALYLIAPSYKTATNNYSLLRQHSMN